MKGRPMFFVTDEPTHSAAVISGWGLVLIITDMFMAIFSKDLRPI